MKSALALLFAAALVGVALADPVDWYDCKGQDDGDYPHPVDCTRFMTCSNGLAYERDCAICETDPMRCPNGRLIFDMDTDRCQYAHLAKCAVCSNHFTRRNGPNRKFL